MKRILNKIAKSNYEKHGLILCFICFLGMLIGNFSERIRYSDFRYLYHFSWITCYIAVFTSLIWSGLNSILIFKESYSNLKRKLFWTLVSLAPILLFLLFMFLAFLQDYNSTDIQLPNGEYIVGPKN